MGLLRGGQGASSVEEKAELWVVVSVLTRAGGQAKGLGPAAKSARSWKVRPATRAVARADDLGGRQAGEPGRGELGDLGAR